MTLTSLRQALVDIVAIAQKAVINFGRHECPQRGAALAYHALFSIFPLLLLAISATGFMLDAGIPMAVDAQTIVLESVEQALPQAKSFVQNIIVAVRESRGGTGLIGLLVLAWSASNIFTQVRLALNAVWETDLPQSLTEALRLRLNAVLLMLGTGFVLLLSFIFNTVLDIVARYATRLPWSETFWPPALSVILSSVTIFFFALLYRFVPRVQLSWSDVWPGAIVAGIGWEALKRVFVWYTTSLANWEIVYGPIVGVIALLLWLYLSAQVLLFGAEFAAAYTQLRHERALPSAPALEGPAEPARSLETVETGGQVESGAPVRSFALPLPLAPIEPLYPASIERIERIERIDRVELWSLALSPTPMQKPVSSTPDWQAEESAAGEKHSKEFARGTIFGLAGIFVAAGVIAVGLLATLWRFLTRRSVKML